MLALTMAKSTSLVGVFIAVTTVPAAAFATIALVEGRFAEAASSALQLVVNLDEQSAGASPKAERRPALGDRLARPGPAQPRRVRREHAPARLHPPPPTHRILITNDTSRPPRPRSVPPVTNEELLRRYQAGGGRLAAANAEGAAVAPALHTAIVTCMDSRIDVFALFGLSMGEVHVLRNAGGVVTDDVVRSLTISQRKLQTREILLVQHTGCGLATFTDDEFSEELAEDVGMRPPWRTHAFTSPTLSVRRGMAQLRHDPFLLPGTVVRGFVLDIEQFTLDEIFVKSRDQSTVLNNSTSRPTWSA